MPTTITYITTVTYMMVYANYYGDQNMVYTIEWDYTGSDGTYSQTQSNSTVIPVDTANFIPYEQLTNDIVQEWITQYTDPSVFTQYQQQITTYITTQYTATTQTLPPPWAAAN